MTEGLYARVGYLQKTTKARYGRCIGAFEGQSLVDEIEKV